MFTNAQSDEMLHKVKSLISMSDKYDAENRVKMALHQASMAVGVASTVFIHAPGSRVLNESRELMNEALERVYALGGLGGR